MQLKAQVSMQFIMAVGFLFVIFVLFIIGLASRYEEINKELEYVLAKDIALKIRREIQLATTLEDGYHRTFTLPEKLEVIDYNITIVNNILVIQTEHHEYSVRIPKIKGHITKGNNSIWKTNNTICIDNSSCGG